MDTKKESRAAVRRAAKDFPDERRAAESEALADAVLADEHFRAASTVALFCSLPDEPDTAPLIHKALETKHVALPVVDGPNMYFRMAEPGAGFRKGAYGIDEPLGDICNAGDIDFILVPGVAFDAEGRRIGRGKGYYDRFLAGCAAFRAGICFSYQMLRQVPCEEHDIRMDTVIHL